jgi:hypothetical protein
MRMEWLRARDDLPACWACFLICANVDGAGRRRKRSIGIRCRIENCVQSFTAVDLDRLEPPVMWSPFPHVIGAASVV